MTDWTTWTIDHPAYRRAVPHHLSFTREREFDSQLLTLTHEITHVLSMLGNIGAALTCLRVAAFDDEVTLWSPALAEADPARYVERLASDGVAPLEDNQPGLLVRAERALEVTLKARALQDAWTPWFEGLALYGELSADPVEDPAMIDPVNEALQHMVDVLPLSNVESTSDAEALRRPIRKRIGRASRNFKSYAARRSPGSDRHG